MVEALAPVREQVAIAINFGFEFDPNAGPSGASALLHIINDRIIHSPQARLRHPQRQNRDAVVGKTTHRRAAKPRQRNHPAKRPGKTHALAGVLFEAQ